METIILFPFFIFVFSILTKVNINAMALDLGNLLGAVTNATTALGKDKSAKAFIKNAHKFGFLVDNMFEVNFSGIPLTTFFVQTIDFGSVHYNYTLINYNGQVVDIPINPDYDHEGNMTLINDGNGYLYSTFSNFLISDAFHSHARSGYTMTIKALTGDKKYKGMIVTLRGVRISTVNGLNYDYSGLSYQKINIGFKYINYSATPGVGKKAAGIIGAVESLIS